MGKFVSPIRPLVEIGKVSDKKMQEIVRQSNKVILVRNAVDGKIYAPTFMAMYKKHRILKYKK
jgi:hypothetical protein